MGQPAAGAATTGWETSARQTSRSSSRNAGCSICVSDAGSRSRCKTSALSARPEHEPTDLLDDCSATTSRTRSPTPANTAIGLTPAGDSRGLHDEKDFCPVEPAMANGYPRAPVEPVQCGPRPCAIENSGLLSKGQNFGSRFTASTEEDTKGGEKREGDWGHEPPSMHGMAPPHRLVRRVCKSLILQPARLCLRTTGKGVFLWTMDQAAAQAVPLHAGLILADPRRCIERALAGGEAPL